MFQSLFHLLNILLNPRRVVIMFVMLTNVEIVSLVKIHLDHQLIIFQFQVLEREEVSDEGEMGGMFT